MVAPSPLPVQLRFAPVSICFGCGPGNPDGLHLQSFEGAEGSGGLLATWRPMDRHQAFPGVLNGGIIGTLLDCHGNWSAAMHLMRTRGLDAPPACVTADYAVRLRRPTPTDRPVDLRARAVETDGDRVVVDAELGSDGIVTATCRGTFVAVGPDHPAFGRW